MKKLTYLFAIAFLICSCSKDNALKNGDDNLLVSKIVAIWTNETVEVIDFVYEGNKLLTIKDLNGMVTTFSYNTEGLLTGITKDINSGAYINTYFVYDEDSELTSYTDFYNNTDNNIDTEDKATKYDIQIDNENNTILRVYGGNHHSQTNFIREEIVSYNNGNRVQENSGVNYFYDDKNGLFKNIHALKTLRLLNQSSLNGIHINTSHNNVFDIKKSSDDGEIIEEFEYLYNDNNYPIRATYKVNGEMKADIEYFLSKE